ncbi:MAG: cytochrome b [Gammaproteobacteria bacterium]
MSNRYAAPIILVHWLTVLLIAALFAIGWSMVDLPRGPERHAAFSLHKSLGLTAALLLALRVALRMRLGAPPLPGTIPAWKRRAAQATHGTLYALLAVQPLSGYLSSSFSGYSTRWFGIPLPQWGREDHALNQFFTDIHVGASVALCVCIVIHVGGALTHVLSPGDGTFSRMLPRRVRR